MLPNTVVSVVCCGVSSGNCCCSWSAGGAVGNASWITILGRNRRRNGVGDFDGGNGCSQQSRILYGIGNWLLLPENCADFFGSCFDEYFR